MGTKNRAFESDEAESPQRSDNHEHSDVPTISRKVFPHGVHAPDLSKFVRILI